ncbi:MAG TPA: hypothetical protein VF228_16530 [Iamia sp.]
MSLPPGPNLAPVEVREAVPDPLPSRPATIRAATAAMVLGGVIAALDALVRLIAWDRDDLERSLDDAGITPGDLEGFFTIVRVVGFLGGLAVAATWFVHAVACDRGRRWVRPWAGALATIFVLMNLTNLTTTDSAAGLAYLVLRTAVAVAAVALLWLPPSTAFLRAAAKGR